jgi:hypothetical protein
MNFPMPGGGSAGGAGGPPGSEQQRMEQMVRSTKAPRCQANSSSAVEGHF